MNATATIRSFFAALLCGAAAIASAQEARREINPDAKLHRFSTTVEKERPELDEETKRLIAAFRRDPSDASRAALRAKVAANYDAVLARKKAKLEDLKKTARDASKVDEMQVIVDEMVRDREARIDATMARFSDARLRPGLRDGEEPYKAVLGAKGRNVSIGCTPVTCAEYAAFLKATGRKAPKYWPGGAMPPDRADHPVVWVSFDDALAYCAWLEAADPAHRYRLPTEEEWELAAGHMPKDADFNCGGGGDTTPVGAYAGTKGACGGVDFWGNCWEWTSTEIVATNGAEKGRKVKEIKGGSWYANRASCRTESRGEGRAPSLGYNTVGFRVIREDR